MCTHLKSYSIVMLPPNPCRLAHLCVQAPLRVSCPCWSSAGRMWHSVLLLAGRQPSLLPLRSIQGEGHRVPAHAHCEVVTHNTLGAQ